MIIFLRGFILLFTLICVSIASTVILIKYLGWLVGLFSSIILFFILAIILIVLFNKFSDKKITNFDLMLPLIISFISAICFLPFSFFQAEIFSSATCLISGIFMSIALYKLKNDMIHKSAVMIIFCTFLYEILPISLPTDLDNFLSVGIGTTSLLFGRKNVSKILELQNQRKELSNDSPNKYIEEE